MKEIDNWEKALSIMGYKIYLVEHWICFRKWNALTRRFIVLSEYPDIYIKINSDTGEVMDISYDDPWKEAGDLQEIKSEIKRLIREIKLTELFETT